MCLLIPLLQFWRSIELNYTIFFVHVFFFFFLQSDILGSYVRIPERTSKNRTEPNLCRFWNRLWKSFSASNKTNVYSIFFHLFKNKNYDLHKIMMFLLRIIWSENAEIFTGLTVKSLIRSVRPVLLRISGLIQFTCITRGYYNYRKVIFSNKKNLNLY